MFPVEIRGDRLTLREFTVGDAEIFHELITHPEMQIGILDAEVATMETVVAVLTERNRLAQRPDRRNYELAVTRDGEIIGTCSLTNIETMHRRCELGYMIHPDHQGHGYASEAARLIIQFGFTELGLHRIEATTAPNNAGSQRVLEKIGFSYEGRARDHFLVRGQWRDSDRYAILATDS